jgi:hypothetical protein
MRARPRIAFPYADGGRGRRAHSFMNTSSTLGRLRFITAILLVGLEFTNLVPFLAESRYFGAQHSRYPLQYAAYGVRLWPAGHRQSALIA